MTKIFYFSVVVLSTVTSFAAKIPLTATKEINISASLQTSILIQPTKVVPGYGVSASTMQDLQQAIGRKLSLKEKIGRHFYEKHLNQQEPTEKAVKKANAHAVLGFVFSLLGLFVFPLFAIPALIFSVNALAADRVNPEILTKTNYSLAKAGKIIAYIEFALLFIILVLVFAWVASG